jgi:hypothetical protein
MQKSLAGAALALVLALVVPGGALAQEKEAAPCREDAARLCGEAKGRARQTCLAEKRDQLSEACRARVDRAAEGAGRGGRARLAACRADLERLCPGVQPGDGALRRCLVEHRDALSEQCRAQLGAAR